MAVWGVVFGLLPKFMICAHSHASLSPTALAAHLRTYHGTPVGEVAIAPVPDDWHCHIVSWDYDADGSVTEGCDGDSSDKFDAPRHPGCGPLRAPAAVAFGEEGKNLLRFGERPCSFVAVSGLAAEQTAAALDAHRTQRHDSIGSSAADLDRLLRFSVFLI